MAKHFIDTNILVYLLSADAVKANRAEAIVRQGGIVSVQVLNELAHVCARKLKMSWEEIQEVLDTVRSLNHVEPLTVDTHEKGLHLTQRYRFSLYDGMIVSAVWLAGCEILYSEDMQHGLVVEQRLRIENPFTMAMSTGSLSAN